MGRSCDCPVCGIGRGLDAVHAALEALLNREAENDMAFAYLLDEVEAVVGSRRTIRVRRRLREALRIAKS